MPVADGTAAVHHFWCGCTCHHYSANYTKQDQNFLYVLIKQRMQIIKYKFYLIVMHKKQKKGKICALQAGQIMRCRQDICPFFFFFFF